MTKEKKLTQEELEFLAKKGEPFFAAKGQGYCWMNEDYEEFSKVLGLPSLTQTQMEDIIRKHDVLDSDGTPQAVTTKEETRDTVSRASENGQLDYEKMDAAQLKASYDDLNSRIDNLATCAEKAVESLTPLYVEMRSLLSQRGNGRAKVLKSAGCPTWYQWSQSFAKRCQATVRTCNRHAKLLAEGVAMHPKTTKPQDGFKPLKPAEQRRLAKAAVVGMELVKSYENNGSDLPELVREYKSLAVSPDRLEDAVTGGGTDYEGILKCLLRELLSSPKVTLNQEGWNIVRKAAKAAGIPVLEEREKAA